MTSKKGQGLTLLLEGVSKGSAERKRKELSRLALGDASRHRGNMATLHEKITQYATTVVLVKVND